MPLHEVVDGEQVLAAGEEFARGKQLVEVGQVLARLVHVLHALVERVAGLESRASRLDQLEQVVPEHEDVAFARIDALDVVVVLLLEHLGDVDDVAHALLEGANVGLDGLLLLERRLHGLHVDAELVADDELLRVVEPLLAHRRLLVELGRQLLQVLLSHELVAQRQLALVLGLLQLHPRSIDVRYELALLGHIGALIVRAYLALDGEESHLQVALVAELGRLVVDAIVVEGGELLLHALQRVGEAALAQLANREPDPVEQVAGEALVGADVGVDLHGRGDHLGDAFALHLVVLELREVVIVGDHVGHDHLLVRILDVDVLGLEQARDAQAALGRLKRVVQVVGGVALLQRRVLDELGLVLVYERVEGEAVAPRRREVAHVHVRIVGRLDLTPQEERVFGRARLFALERQRTHLADVLRDRTGRDDLVLGPIMRAGYCQDDENENCLS